MGKNLILLTNYFPYYKGEEYIESELPILAKKFENILIISCLIGENEPQTREVPENVSVMSTGKNNTKLFKLKMFMEGLLKYPYKLNKNILNQLYEMYFIERSNFLFEAIEDELGKKLNKHFDSSNTIIYSYWFYLTAKMGLDINNLFFDNKCKVITRAHRYDIYENFSALNFLPLRTKLLDELNYVFPVSEDGTQYLINQYPDYTDKIKTKYLGTKPNTTRIQPATDELVIFSCSGIRKIKRIDRIINVIENIKNKGIKVKWYHIGDGELATKYEKIATAKLTTDTFKFLGRIPNEKVVSEYKAKGAHFFINLSDSEGIPVSIMEALSVGLPVIATDVGGTREIINSNVGCLIDVQTKDEEIANKIIELYKQNNNEYIQMQQNCIKNWENNFNSEKNYNNFSDLLIDLVGGE